MRPIVILSLLIFLQASMVTGGDSELIEISNGKTKVVVDLAVGGRIVEYSVEGNNVIHQFKEEQSHLADSYGPGGGRMDFGPEKVAPPRPETWTGSWQLVEKTDLFIKIKSQVAKQAGVQLIREIQLDENSTHLQVTQRILNVSSEPKRYNHWSRTFGKENGICLAPLNENSRFPKGYMTYPKGNCLDYMPKENENSWVKDGILFITAAKQSAKYITDDNHGWLAYLTPDDQLFVKKFKVFEDQVYGEMTGATVSVWTSPEGICEIEPIGPWEWIEPGKQISFVENWYLSSFPFSTGDMIDIHKIKSIIDRLD